MLNIKAFEKRSLPKWSKSVHTIVDAYQHSYKLDNGKTYKYYELQRVDYVQKLDQPDIGPTRQQLITQRSVKKKFKLTGLNKEDIVNVPRERKPVDRLKYPKF